VQRITRRRSTLRKNDKAELRTGKVLFAEFEQNIDCWKMLFAKHYRPTAIRAHIAHYLFLAQAPMAKIPTRARVWVRPHTRKTPKKPQVNI
jgi:hypothetical protein